MRHAIFLALLALPVLARAQNDPAASPQDTETRLKTVEDQLNALTGAPAPTSVGAFNPAVGMALDSTFHQQNKNDGFQFRAAELNLEAPADPFIKVYGVITGSNQGVDVEEAAAETTSLPASLMVRAGRFFASFGRQAHFHDHELNVVDRPTSLDTYIGGETRADGAEVEYVFPTPFFLHGVVGYYNQVGTNNNRNPFADVQLHPFNTNTFLGRLNTYADLNDDNSVELGVDTLYTPKRAQGQLAGSTSDSERTLDGVDFTYRYTPVKGGLYNGILWGTEILRNSEMSYDPATTLPLGRHVGWAGYSFVESKVGLNFRPGVMLDLTQNPDSPGHITRTYAAYITYNADEFNRLRLQYSHVNGNAGLATSDTIALQWTAVIGWHVHGFRDR